MQHVVGLIRFYTATIQILMLPIYYDITSYKYVADFLAFLLRRFSININACYSLQNVIIYTYNRLRTINPLFPTHRSRPKVGSDFLFGNIVFWAKNNNDVFHLGTLKYYDSIYNTVSIKQYSKKRHNINMVDFLALV